MTRSDLDVLLRPYLDVLRDMPFVEAIDVSAVAESGAGDAVIVLHTSDGSLEMLAEVKRVHAGYDVAERAAAELAAGGRQGLLLAPLIGAPLGSWLADRGICYVDSRGNCDLRLGGRYYWHVEGRTRGISSVATTMGVRAPGFQVLYTLLARPELTGAPVREVAAAAGTSRQPVVDMFRRLVDEGLVVRSRKGRSVIHRWVDHRRGEAFEQWSQGYRTALRPRLLLGRYQLPETDLEATEARVARQLSDAGVQWRWGGSSAAWRLVPWHRPDHVVVHVDSFPREVVVKLRALPARDGRLLVLHHAGPTSLCGLTEDTIEPLLAYTEMMTQGDEREREAAGLLAQKERGFFAGA